MQGQEICTLLRFHEELVKFIIGSKVLVIGPFCDKKIKDSFLSNHFIQNNPKEVRTKLPNKFEKYIWT